MAEVTECFTGSPQLPCASFCRALGKHKLLSIALLDNDGCVELHQVRWLLCMRAQLCPLQETLQDPSAECRRAWCLGDVTLKGLQSVKLGLGKI